jgi:Alpha amylase, catalytic domain
MGTPRYPSLFQVNTRIYLAELSTALGRQATLDDITDAELDTLAADGFDLIWFLGVWQTGKAARQVSKSNPEWLSEYHRILPDFQETDVSGSCFAICDYHVHTDFGGDDALARLRERLRQRGLRLILDFVPNHVALDHSWVKNHPDFFILGNEEQLLTQPQNYRRLNVGGKDRIVAYGRDPYFAGWPDTLQLNYGSPEMQESLFSELRRIAEQCDGVRCDMAMLVLPEVFERTWGIASSPFWPRVTDAIHTAYPGFLFLAEVYWDLEWTLQQQGFDYTYDKRLYDRLVQRQARPVREHFYAGLDFQDHLARFLENHDEPRAAATFPREVHQAAAVITFFTPGLRFFHQGQKEGKRVHIPVHLARGPVEVIDISLSSFYDSLITCLQDPAFRDGNWQLLDTRPAWEGNASNDAFVAFSWSGPENLRRLVAINYSDHKSQCYVSLPWNDLRGQVWSLQDKLGTAVYDRNGDDLISHGLYLDMPPWGYHVFTIQPAQ